LQEILFNSVTDAIDTTTSRRFFFHLVASLAQMERERPVEKSRAGLKAARWLIAFSNLRNPKAA
jgi:DNA invertase Pin-like site-specific DNA recombinase